MRRAVLAMTFGAFGCVAAAPPAPGDDIGSHDPASVERAVHAVFAPGVMTHTILHALSRDSDPTTAYRGRQLLDLFRARSNRGLKCGFLVRTPESQVGHPVPGWDVFINTSGAPLAIETDIDLRICGLETVGWS